MPLGTGRPRDRRAQAHPGAALDDGARVEHRAPGVSLHASTFSRTVWRLYGGANGLVVWYQDTRVQKQGLERSVAELQARFLRAVTSSHVD